ncbi:hypothetical protein T10_4505 [Trichinella papuae]|uniref:Uncharacterized protein n=1 Tax=Trichinella papuae TaxID=268474 RepID=A0A0V1M603_9BILA|nr:hypothetical protein T10_4505 [Trichinella papuae]
MAAGAFIITFVSFNSGKLRDLSRQLDLNKQKAEARARMFFVHSPLKLFAKLQSVVLPTSFDNATSRIK